MAMHSKDRLAAALKQAGLGEMSARAAQGYYHDVLSPLPAPAIALANELAAVGTPAARDLRARHLRGEFDAPSSEWEAERDEEGDD
jgi:hypothetical protein